MGLKVIITRMFGLFNDREEFKIEQVEVNGKKSLPKITKASGGPIPVVKVEEDKEQ